MKCNYDPLILKKAKTAAIAYVVVFLIVAGLYFVPMLIKQKLEWTYQAIIFLCIFLFLAFQFIRSIRLYKIIRETSVSLDETFLSGADNCNAMKRPEPFSVRLDSIQSASIKIQKDVPPIGKVPALHIKCNDGESYGIRNRAYG